MRRTTPTTSCWAILLQLVLPAVCWVQRGCHAYFFVAPRRHNALRTRYDLAYRHGARTLRMDAERDDMGRHHLHIPAFPPLSTTTRQHKVTNSVTAAAYSHGMPWQHSISANPTGPPPLYLLFWQWQLDTMTTRLSNLQVLPTVSRNGSDLSYMSNDKNMRLHTCRFGSDEYESVRMTLLDGGPTCQVFTSLWTPQPGLNLPVLGIDLLAFNSRRLCIVDFQPLHEAHAPVQHIPFEHLLQPVRQQYPSLQHAMTSRFYDPTQFFSKAMLLGRSNGRDDDWIEADLWPALQHYTHTHINLAQHAGRLLEHDPVMAAAVKQRLQCYDDHLATRDPAHKLLTTYFGAEWADVYVHDVLFPRSRSK